MRRKKPPNKEIADHLSYDFSTGKLRWAIPTGTRGRVGDQAGFLCVNTGYRFVKFQGRRYMEHRVVWLMAYGDWPENEIDHIDGNKSNNAISNLRDVSHVENTKNAKIQSNNTSGVSGVGWFPLYSKWRVRLSDKTLGYYEDFHEAVSARKQAEKDNGYHQNHGRAT